MAQQQFARGTLFFDGVELETTTSIGHETHGGWAPVRTIKFGLSGFCPTGGHCTCNVGFAVPLGGTEAAYQEKCVEGAIVALQLTIGGKDYLGNGQILNVKFDQSTDKELTGSFDWMGEIAPLQ